MNKNRFLLFFFAALALPCQVFPQKGIHKKIDELVLSNKFEEAEKAALKEYNQFPNEPEVICALACVYRNKSRKSRLIVDVGAMGIKDDETGTYTLKDTSEFKNIFQEEIYYDPANYAKAESLYFRIISIDSTYHNAYFNLMNDYVTMHHFEKYFQITDLFIEKLKGDPSTADYLLDQAKMLMEKEYYDEALPLYQKTATAFPDRIEAKSDIGAVYSKKGDIIHARDIFKEVFMTDGKDQINLKNYIFTSILTEDFTTAFKLYEEICELDKDNYSHYFDIGFVACLLDKDYKTYLNHFREKHKVTVKSIEKDFWYQNASVLLTLDTKSKKEKIEFYEYLLEQFNNSGMYALALISSNMIKKIEVTNLSLIIPASIFDRFNFYEKTIEYLNKISERRKTDESIMSEYNLNSNYGRISYVAKKYRDSITFFSRCFRQKQDNAWLNHYLGMSHLNLNEIIEAKKYFVINSQMNDKGQMTYINNSIRELKKLDSSN